MVIETCATLVTDVRPLAGVRTNVGLEVTLPCKRYVAHIACKGSFARVREDMILKVAHADRRVRTVRTGVQDHATGLDGP